MPYDIILCDQKTNEIIETRIETLKDLKALLTQFETRLFDFEMHEVKPQDEPKKILNHKRKK